MGRSSANGTASASSTTASASGSGELTEVPEETAGPYPGTGPTSQIALPKEAGEAVCATAGDEQSVANLSQVSLNGDNVFGDDGGIHQLASMSADAASGYVAALTVGV